ncbi:MAG: hypothetical protein N2201_07185 [candidate division WOR-3 bacterium]|nr:hypothetical protein [candidate division WOR-3 bacterium]
MKKSIPDYIYKLFWDFNKSDVDINRHANFIIRRVLDYGECKAINWLRQTYSDELIKNVINNKRGLLDKTLIFWRTYYKQRTENV